MPFITSLFAGVPIIRSIHRSLLHDEPFFMLEGNYENDNGDMENIYCGMKRGTKKHFKRNKKEYKRLVSTYWTYPS